MRTFGSCAAAVIGRISDGLGAVAAVCMALLFLLMITEVVARGFFAHSLAFSWEVSGYLMGAAMFLGAARAMKAGAHVRITLLLGLLPDRTARWLDVAATLMGVLIAVMMFRAFALLTFNAWQRGVLSATVSEIPLFIPQSAFALGMLVLSLQLACRLIALLFPVDGSRGTPASGMSP